jgi:Zn-dependent M28 family amino/carboxypeptidase
MLRFSLALALCTAAVPALAADVDTKRLHEHIRVLASDQFAGRGPASPEEKLTVDYLIAEMKKAGLQPGGANGSWTQPVALSRFTVTNPTSSLKVGSWTKPLNQGLDVAIRTRLPQDRLTLKDAPLVFVGYGVKAPERGWDDFKGVDLKGKVALVLVNDPDFELDQPAGFDGEAMTYYGRWTYKYEELAKQGAAGVIVIHETVPAGYGWATVRNSNTIPTFDVVLADPSKERARLEGWIQKPVAEELFQRAGLSFDTLKTQAKTKAFRPVALPNATLSVDAAVKAERITSANVLGKIPGSKRPDEVVLIGSHWDHLGRGGADADGDDIYNGALDNAAGTAGLLELARVMAAGPRPERTVVFASWTAEEKGLLGSEFYAQNPVYPVAKTAAGFNMDGLALNGPARDITIVGAGKSDMDSGAVRVAKSMGLVVSPESNPEVGTFYRSDHFPLAKVGIPVLYMNAGQDLVKGGKAAGEAAYKAYIEDRYHQPNDEYDPNWDLSGALPELNIIRTLATEAANSSTWPQWKAGAEFKSARDRTAAERR